MARTEDSDNKKRARVAGAQSAQGFWRSLGEMFGMVVRPLVPLTVLVVVYAGISFLLWRPLNGESGDFESAAQAKLSEKSLITAFVANPRPAWMPKDDYRQLAFEGAGVGKNNSVMTPGLSRKLAATYERNSWVERVREVRLRYPARMELELDFRKPCAKLERFAVLDRAGFVLNLSAENPILRELPTITGVTVKATPVGRALSEKAALSALDLLSVVRDTLAKSPGNLRVVSAEQSEGMWKLTTQCGSERGPLILWGTFSDDPPIDEPRTQEKLESLRLRLREWPSPALLEYVKLYVANAPVKLRATNGSEISTPTRPH
ncbi:MAG TPA: hypothetical protein VKX17_05145 [Planctomycetota bacterium]|nr:hypothetical protein [Planctomycetota bacterium]